MKKVSTIIGIISLLCVLFTLLFPLAYKAKINQTIQNKLNQSLDANITIDAYKLKFISSFPHFTASFSNVTIVGLNNFEGDTLFSAKKIAAQIDLISLLKNKTLSIIALKVDDASLSLIENKQGMLNWKIEKQGNNLAHSLQKVQKSENGKNELKLSLVKVQFEDFAFNYKSTKNNFRYNLNDVSVGYSATFDGVNKLMAVNFRSPSVNLFYDSISYLENREVNFTTQVNAQLEKQMYSFVPGSSKMNNLPLSIEGGFSLSGGSLVFDTEFEVANLDIDFLLKHIPAKYLNYMKDVSATGQVLYNGWVKGGFVGDSYPQLHIGIKVHQASLKYPELPDELVIDNLHAQIDKAEGPFDLLSFGITDFTMHLANNPFAFHANFSHLFSDPSIDAGFSGVINLADISKVIPLGNTNIKGLLTANATVKGTYSALGNNDFGSFISTGSVELNNFSIENSNVPQGLCIQNAALILANQDILVKGLAGKMGNSDFKLNGMMTGLLSYLFDDEQLMGQFDMNSNKLDLNEFLNAYRPNKAVGNNAYIKVDTLNRGSKPLELPKRINLGFNANINQLLIDKMEITQFKGRLKLENQQLQLAGLTMKMIGGQMNMKGTVIADGSEQPNLNFNLDIIGFDLPLAYRQITMVQKFMPFAAKCQGSFSSKLVLETKIGNDFKTDFSTVSANGVFKTHNVQLTDKQYLSSLKSVIQLDKFKNLKLNDFTATYSINDGDLYIQPFNTGFANQPLTLGGKYSRGGTIDFRVDANIEKELLSNDIHNMIAYIPGHQRIKKVDVGLNITGDAKKPEVNVDYDKIKKQVVQQLKNSSPEELQDAARKLLQGLFK